MSKPITETDESPFPVSVPIEVKDSIASASPPCSQELLTETKEGNLLDEATDEVASEYKEGETVEVVFTGDGNGAAGDYEIEGFAIVSEEGESLNKEAYEFLRDQLGANQALRATDGTTDGTWYFWFSTGRLNGLVCRQKRWTEPSEACPETARSTLTDDKTLQIFNKERVKPNNVSVEGC